MGTLAVKFGFETEGTRGRGDDYGAGWKNEGGVQRDKYLDADADLHSNERCCLDKSMSRSTLHCLMKAVVITSSTLGKGSQAI